MPRSGTSWLSQIIDSSPQVRFRLSPLFSYAFKNAVDEKSSREEYLQVFQEAYLSDNEFMDQSNRRRTGQYPQFDLKDEDPEYLAVKMTRFHNLLTRMFELFEEIQMVSIVRHPCGAIHSWLSTPGEFPQDADPGKEWRSGACRKTGPEEFWGFEDWKRVTRLHMALEREHPDRFTIVQYETVIEQVETEAKRLFEFFGLEYTEQTEYFLGASHSRHDDNPYAVFKDPCVKDRWKSELDPKIQKEIIEEIAGTDLSIFLK